MKTSNSFNIAQRPPQKPGNNSGALNVAFSLFDPQLDHIGENATIAEIKRSRSPILLMHSIPSMPIVTRHVLLVSHVDKKAAARLLPWLEKRIEDGINKRVKNVAAKQLLSSKIAVEMIFVKYDNIWDLNKCRQKIGSILRSKLDAIKAEPCKETTAKSIFVNLASGTAAAKTALFLVANSFARSTSNFRLGVIQENLSGGNEAPLKFQPVLARNPSAIGLLAQGVATNNLAFADDLNRLEQVVMTSQVERILITGPTGAGKSELAKLIMAYMQTLYAGIWANNCIYQNVAAIAPTLIESELFGHEKGAFTGAEEGHPGIFERANNGVVFLDEIGELPKNLQAKLLTIIDGTPFTRVGGTRPISSSFLLICGTNVDLRIACDKGDFRRDLFERLRMWSIEVPALRDRPEDMEQALQRERGEWRSRTGREVFFESKEAKECFMKRAREYLWPGNFREFHATFAHLAMFAGKKGITNDAIEMEFQEKTRQEAGPCELTPIKEGPSSPSTEYDMAEMARLACALDVCRKSKTANEAGKILFSARAKTAEINGTLFNGTSSLQRLFAQFGLKATFRHGVFSVQARRQKQDANTDARKTDERL